MMHAYDPGTWATGAERSYKFKASQVFIVNSGIAGTTLNRKRRSRKTRKKIGLQ